MFVRARQQSVTSNTARTGSSRPAAGGPVRPAAAELLAAVRARDGDSVVRGEEALASEAKSIQWSSLPPDVLRALRAGALIGPGFEIKDHSPN